MADLTTDSLRSLITGMGDPTLDKSSSVFYADRFLSDNQIHAAYRNTWLAKKIVNIPALDALRKWRNWQADQGQITLIENEEKRLGLQKKLLQCKTLARLWGGAVIFIGDGTDAAQPWEPERVGKGGLRYLTVMSRREMISKELDQDPESPSYGMPVGYTISNGRSFTDIHPSRVVIQIGDELPDPWNTYTANQGWGDSVLQSVFTAVTQADSTAANIASLVFEANVDVYKIQDLMEHMSSAPYRQKLIDRFTLANIGKSVSRALITDADEEYDRKQIAFTGLPDVLQQFLILVSGAADIPLTRLLGQSPSGLSSTGEHDMKNYYDRVSSIQTLEIGPAMVNLDEALIRSALGSRPAEIYYNWNELEQMNDKERAEIGKMKADAANILVTTGLFMPEELRESVGNQLVEDGFYPGLGELLKKNGEKLPEFDLERRASEAGVNALENPEPSPQAPITDAAPRTLYMRRDVLNGAEIAQWFKDQGVPDVYAPESMHVTVVYSKTAIDWMKMGQAWEGRLEIPEGGPRVMDKFGDAGDVLVQLFASRELQWRHEQAKEMGATSDHPEYQAHISISLRGADIDLVNIKPWQGPILLGPEIFEEIDDSKDWREKVVTDGFSYLWQALNR